MNLFSGQQRRRRHREQTWRTQQGKRKGEGGMNGEDSMETSTPPCVKETASGNLLWLRLTQTGAL